MTAPAAPRPAFGGADPALVAPPVYEPVEYEVAESDLTDAADAPRAAAPKAPRPPLIGPADAARARAMVRAVATPWGVVTAVLFAYLFARPAYLLGRDWWSNPEAGHGLLLAPIALWFAFRAGVREDAAPNRVLGGALIVAGVGFRWIADLASELFTMRGSMLMALAGLVVWHYGWRQLMRWWLPFTLIALSIPLPELVLSRVALPLQLTASKIGAGLLRWRDIDVLLTGNVIRIPGHELFVAEACSGLRSLTALISLGVLLGAIMLRTVPARLALFAAVAPVAILLNGVRVFLTGFLVFFVDPKLGEGFMHMTEGMFVFGIAFAILGGIAYLLERLERRVRPQAPAFAEVAHA